MIELLSYTAINKALIQLAGLSDVYTLFQSKGEYADTLFEYAARVCYRSTDKLGTAPNFITQRLDEGHEDVIEHASFTFRLPAGIAIQLPFINPHIIVSPLWSNGRGGDTSIVRDADHPYLWLASDWVVTGNTRVWLKLFEQGVAIDVLPYLKALAPKTFASFTSDVFTKLPAQESFWMAAGGTDPQTVIMLAANFADKLDPQIRFKHGSATFLIEHVSRTLTHQLVRHRLGSFSQESQRYVDLSKGGWQPIIPPAVAEKPDSLSKMEKFFQIAETTYAELRADGIRREDARFLLPGATESRLVMSMDFAGWDNFFWQRLHKSAQWEIRNLAQAIHAMLWFRSPDIFKEREVYEKGR